MPLRTKPMLVAPLIPVMGFLGILGLDEFHGTRYMHAVIALWCAAMLALTIYVIKQARQARRLQKGAR